MTRYLILITVSFICYVHQCVGQSFSITEIKFNNDSLNLYANVYEPSILVTDKIGIALIQGSGDSDRTNQWSVEFAEFLAQNGFYVLQPDKRGCGKSQGSWKTSSFLELGGDALSSALTLKEMYGLDKVGVLGLSQGGKIAPIAARNANIDFVINVSGSAVTVEKQIIHEVTNTAIMSGLNPEEIVGVLDLHVAMKDYAFDRDWKPMEVQFEKIENSSWSKFGMTFPNKPDLWIWDWVERNIEFDPMEYWTVVEQDVFIAYGSQDERDNVPVYESIYLLQKGFKEVSKSNYEIHLYTTGHSLRSENGLLNNDFQTELIQWLNQL